VRAAQLRDRCLALPGVEETFPFSPGTSVFKVVGKIRPGYHLNKRHWNTVTIDGSLPDQMIYDMVEDSYDLVASRLPAATRRRLG
jgi:predicted DNA-binding protein (MmcQ/YjbR family)